MDFQLKSSFNPTGDQPEAINSLVQGIKKGLSSQVLLGVTGSVKTFTIANVINSLNIPTLVISHNKTLAAQLYQEFRDFFPKNAVSYFVSYYDYYQPEAYIPHTDTYIEKETEINEQIDRLRLAATTNILTRKDTLLVASVSCIYNLGSPKNYQLSTLDLKSGLKISKESLIRRLVDLQYRRGDYDFKRGTFRVRGEYLDIFLPYEEETIRIFHDGEKILGLEKIAPITGAVLSKDIFSLTIFPTKHYIPEQKNIKEVYEQINHDLKKEVENFRRQNKLIEAERLFKRVSFDLEMIEEIGYVNGIENYSRYFDGRKQGEPPFTLLDYYNFAYGKNWLMIIDESHQTIPQLNGMYNGDRSRKETLINFGFRLKAALDNRPLRFTEFLHRIPQTIFVSATPDSWEIEKSKGKVIEQMIRPTGIVDPKIIIKPTKNQIFDLSSDIIKRKKKGQRVLITTLTKRIAEDLCSFFNEKNFIEGTQYTFKEEDYPRVAYLHSDIETLERSDILDNLRLGKYDVLIGINLLREGLDLPEVSLVAILDADKEGFLRSQTSLIQTMGRAARHIDASVVMYADHITISMEKAIKEIERRRNIQLRYNQKNNIIPQTIIKPIREKLITEDTDKKLPFFRELELKRKFKVRTLNNNNLGSLTPFDRKKLIKVLEREMRKSASLLNFEEAAQIRDKIRELKNY